MNRPPKDLYEAIANRINKDAHFAVATVLKAQGSTPCKAGAKAVIEADGSILGTIGGGAVEAHAQRLAVEAIKSGRPLVFDFNLEGNAVKAGDPICGGTMRVLVDSALKQGHRTGYADAALARKRRQRGLLITAVQSCKAPAPDRLPEIKVVFYREQDVAETTFATADELRSILKSRETKLFVEGSAEEGPRLEVLVEAIVPNPLLAIAGGGHVGQALALQADLVGFDILVIDDRPEFTDGRLFPEGATTRCASIAKEIAGLSIGDDTYIVIVTRGHQHDAEALAACIRKPAAYIGMIGSRHKVAMMRKEFIESGKATADEFDRVFTPIGLDIGSVTVPEIAASIVAQLIAVRRKGAAAAGRLIGR
jgi:xanthine dehydrogenase accessory factor